MVDALKNGVKGKIPDMGHAIASMVGWDNQEEVTVGSAAVTLTSGLLGDGASGIGDGRGRVDYYCQGVYNNTASAITVKYETLIAGAGKTFTLYLPAGAFIWPLTPISKILGTGSGTSASSLVLMYRDMRVVNGFLGETRD